MKSLSSFPGLSSVLPRADFLSTDPAQERRSPLGIFLRGLLVTLRRISFDETAHLARQIAQWCGANFDGPSWPVHIWSLNRKVAMEDTLDKRVKAMDEWVGGLGLTDKQLPSCLGVRRLLRSASLAETIL